MIKRNLLLCGMLLSGFNALAQHDIMNDTLVWKVVEVKNKATDETISKHNEVVVFASEKIVWEQSQTGRKYSFMIESITGDWEDLDKEGHIEYHITIGDSNGIIRFKRDTETVSIDFDLRKGEKITFPFLLLVESIQPK